MRFHNCSVPYEGRPLEGRGTHLKLCEKAETKVGSQLSWSLPQLPKQVKWRNSGPPTNLNMIDITHLYQYLFSELKISIISRKDW